MDIILSLDEAITNIILHGYKDRPESSRVDLVELEMDFSINSVDILICDAGKEYDISRIPVPNIEDNMKNNKDGGFGVYLMKSLMDDIKLSRQQNKNCLRMKKSVQPV
jgi:sigma-B regulation protein RsbU (phosphoserine phosphatase)